MPFRLIYDRHRERDRSRETWVWTYQPRLDQSVADNTTLLRILSESLRNAVAKATTPKETP